MVSSKGCRIRGRQTTIVEGYKLGPTIGSGNFASVYAATSTTSQKHVAIKIVPKSNADGKLEAEIENQSRLQHKHIVEVSEVVRTDLATCIVMELVVGGSLYDYIVSGEEITEEKARQIFQQLIAGVNHCHSNNLVHRDLKPENILLDLDGNVKIADFGFSGEIVDGELLSESCGSPNYVAPELLKRKRAYGYEVDVWSCGVILYALLCKQLPFDASSVPDLFKLIEAGRYPKPAGVSEKARDLVDRMLTVDPTKRITVSAIMEHPWFVQNLPSELAVRVQEQVTEPEEPDLDERPLREESIVFRNSGKMMSIASLLSVASLLLSKASASHLNGSQARFSFYSCFLPLFGGFTSLNV